MHVADSCPHGVPVRMPRRWGRSSSRIRRVFRTAAGAVTGPFPMIRIRGGRTPSAGCAGGRSRAPRPPPVAGLIPFAPRPARPPGTLIGRLESAIGLARRTCFSYD